MKMPEVQEIIVAVQNKNAFLRKAGEFGELFISPSSKRPFYYAGGMAMTFLFKTPTDDKAVRIWLKSIAGQKDRYQHITSCFSKKKYSWAVATEYIDLGIQIAGQDYPILCMDWCKGQLLFEYIESHIGDSEILAELATAFLELTLQLHDEHIAHGDLHPDNIFVMPNGELKLIDYDTLLMPGMPPVQDEIDGKLGFQHPKRSENQISDKRIDYFSELIIYLGLLITAELPNFWGNRADDSTESFYFQPTDFNNLGTSEIYLKLREEKNDRVNILLDILQTYLNTNEIIDLDPFQPQYLAHFNPPVILQFAPNKGVLQNQDQGEVTLSWEVLHASEVFIEGYPSSASDLSKGSYALKISHDTEFCLKARSKRGKESYATAKVALDVYPPKVIHFGSNLTVTDAAHEGKVDLTWECEGAVKTRIHGYSDSWVQDGSGSYTVRIYGPTALRLEAYNYLNVVTEHVLQVGVVAKDPEIISLRPEGPRAIAGYPFKVELEVKGAEEIRIQGPGIDVVVQNGEATIYPLRSGEHQLVAHGYFEETVKGCFHIHVMEPPKIQKLLLPQFKEISIPAISMAPLLLPTHLEEVSQKSKKAGLTRRLPRSFVASIETIGLKHLYYSIHLALFNPNIQRRIKTKIRKDIENGIF